MAAGDIRKLTCIVIRKNGEYLVGRQLGGGGLKWSWSIYEAWRTRDRKEAEAVARATGGVMVLFNPVVNQKKVMGA